MIQARPLSPSVAAARGPRWPWLALLAVLLAIAVGAGVDRWRESGEVAQADPAGLRPGFGPTGFAESLASTQQRVAAARENVALISGEWLREEGLAAALLARFRLTGDYRDLAEADAVLTAAMARVPDPAGPVLSRAMFEVLVHRLDRADAALARFARSAAPDDNERADAAALAGDIALQRGQSAAASGFYARAARMAPSPGIALRRAVLAARRGERAQAGQALEALLAAPRQPPALLGELALQRASLAYAVGDWDGAAQWVTGSNRVYPGYWLAEAYAAQSEALAGRTGTAIRALTAIAKRTGRPEVMDALAHLLRLEGRGAASRAWAAKAAAGWEARAALFPEAAIQHRAEHELAVGSVARALALAEADVAARPGPQGIALLARALVLSGRPRVALRWLDKSRDAGFVGAGALMLRADAEAALGNATASQAARDAALAINPRAGDPAARLIWFGHD